jgi:hypothetical protein
MPSKGHLVIPYVAPIRPSTYDLATPPAYPRTACSRSRHGCFSLYRTFTVYLSRSLSPTLAALQCKRRGSRNPAYTVTRVRGSYPWCLSKLSKLYSPSHFSQSALVPATTSGVSSTDQPTQRALTTTADAAFSDTPIAARQAHRRGTDRAAAYSLSITVIGASTRLELRHDSRLAFI